MTRDGGSNNWGTVFKLKTDGTGFAVIVNFDYSTKGANPVAGLNQGADGYLYGTAPSGGSNEAGTVFRLNPDGTGFAVIKPLSFPASAGPYGGVIQGTDGNLYGLATGGGADGLGALYQLKPDGADFSVLANFDYYTTGGFPNYALIQGRDGNLYGTTDQGGASGGGTAFRLVFPNLKDRKQEVQQALSALLPSGNKETDKRLQKAIDGIAKSLNPALWKDGNHLATKDGQKVFEGEKQAVQVLTEVWNDKKTPARVVTAAGDAIDKLVIIDIDLATTAMADAMTAGGNGKKLAEATRELGRAAAADQAGKADEAIDHARKAWEKAQESLKK